MNCLSLPELAHDATRRARFSGSQAGRRVLCAGIVAILCVGLSLFVTGCERKVAAQQNVAAGTGPTPAVVEPDLDANNFKVDHPERFPLASAGEYIAAPELNVTGVVNPDVSRQVPVPSLATGRVIEIDARLGDEVKKGQLLFKVRVEIKPSARKELERPS